MKKNNGILIAAIVVVVLVGLGGGGYYVFLGGADPLKRAEQLAAKGDLRGAQIELRNAVRAEPNSALAHLKLAQTQMQLADMVAAEKEFKTARDLGYDRWAIIPQLGQVYMAQAHYQDVLTEVPPEGPTAEIAAKNLMLRSMAQVGMNDIVGATASLTAAEKAAPGNLEVLLTASRLALALKDYTLAEQKVTDALAVDPKQVDALLMKGQILLAKGDKAAAMDVLTSAITVAPNAPAARLERANQYMQAGQDDKAMADVAAVLQNQPRNAGATYLNGVLLVRKGKYADAQVELQKLGPVIQRFPRAMYFQALAAANLGQNEVAIDFANRYVARLPADLDGVRLVARTELAAGRPERAVNVLTKAVAAGQSDPQMLDLLGRAYAMLGKGPEAIETFKKAVAGAPDDATILTHLASTQMQLGDATAAAAALERSVELAPSQPTNAEALVAAALSAGDMDKAEVALNRLRAQVGETEGVGILTGMLKLGRLDLDGGRAAFADTLKKFPESLNAKLNLGKVLILQGRRAEGEALLREILAKDPANVPTLNTMVQILTQSNQFPAAVALVDAAKAAAPKNVGFTAMLSDLIVRSGDPRRSVAMLLAMRSSEELPPMLLSALGRAQEAAGLLDDAKASYRDVLKATPNDLDARRGQVELLLRNREPDAAKASLREGLAQSPGNIGIMTALVTLESRTNGPDAGLKLAEELRNNSANLPNSAVLKGDALMGQARYAEAAQAFLAEYKITATGPLILRLANAEASAGKDDDAARDLRNYMRNNPTDADAAQLLGILDVKAKRYDDAEKNLGIVLSSRPSNPVALNNLAWVYLMKGDARARQTAQRAYLQAPTPESADTLGWIMVKGGDAKSGLPLLQQSSVQRPNDSTVKYHLAVALKENGRGPDAVKVLQPIVSSADAFDDKDAARKLLAELTPNK